MKWNFWQGEKVKLRAVETKDFNWSEDYDNEADRTTGGRIYPNLSGEIMKKRFEERIVHNPKDDSFWWTIEDKEGNSVGHINTFKCDPQSGTFGFGITIQREFRRKGFAKEAIKLVLRYYFRELRYQKVTTSIFSFNEPSLKLHMELGFMQEGKIRRAKFTNGKYHDEIIVGMTKEEFDEIDEIREINL